MYTKLDLNGLAIFEASGKSSSFKIAAEQLHITPSAVSFAIKKLETELGTALFQRKPRQLVLTKEGQDLLTYVSSAFEHLRQGVNQLSATVQNEITLYSSPTYASYVLHPLMKTMMERHQHLTLRLVTESQPDLRKLHQFDVSIIYGEITSHENLELIPIGIDELTPVCSPSIASQISSINDLENFAQIVSENQPVTWRDWFALNGYPQKDTCREIHYSHSYQSIDSLMDGMGVSLESMRFIRHYINEGKLVAPLFNKTQCIKKHLHHIAVSTRRKKSPIIDEILTMMETFV